MIYSAAPGMARGMSVVLHDVLKRDPLGHVVLGRLSFEVKTGEHVAIVGRSGSGKSVILRLIAAVELPTEGVVLVDGVPTSAFDYRTIVSHRMRTGYVFMSRGLLVNATIEDNVALPLRYHRGAVIDEEEVQDRVATVLGELDIADVARRLPSETTPSERKRALFARALILEPALLLCDEPQTSLVLQEQLLVRKACERRRASRQMTIIQTDLDGVFGPLRPDRTVDLTDVHSVHNPASTGEIEA